MKRKFSIFLSSFLLSIVFIIASSPFVSAVDVNDFDYSFEIQAPVATSNSGYIEFVTENWGPILFYFTATMNSVMYNDHSAVFSFYAYINSGNELCVEPTPNTNVGEEVYVNVCGFYLQHQGWSNWMSSEFREDGSTIPIRMWLGNCGQILYARGYNVDLSGNLGVNSNFPSFIYGSDNRLFNQLDYITRLLEQNGQGFSSIIDNANNNANNIQQNQNENTDKILNFGSDKGQPDFGATNGKLDDTVGQIESIEGSYQIDQAATNTALSTGTSFLQGSDMQRASLQVKTWIERFSSENRVVTGFLIAAMVLGLCFWVIGRKAWSK